MKIAENQYTAYLTFGDFVEDFLTYAAENDFVSLIVNWEDALAVCQLLNRYTIGGKSIAMRREFADEAYADAQSQTGNMLITVFNNAEMICEKALDNPEAYVDGGLYFVEFSAGEVNLPLHAKVIPFKIDGSIFDGVF